VFVVYGTWEHLSNVHVPYALLTAILMDSTREDLPRVSVGTVRDWQRLKSNYTQAALARLEEHVSANNLTDQRDALLDHMNQVIHSIQCLCKVLTRFSSSSSQEPLQSHSQIFASTVGISNHSTKMNKVRRYPLRHSHIPRLLSVVLYQIWNHLTRLSTDGYGLLLIIGSNGTARLLRHEEPSPMILKIHFVISLISSEKLTRKR